MSSETPVSDWNICLVYYFNRDKREMTSQTEYFIENVKDDTLYRNPGEINGQSVNIQNCQVNFVKIFFAKALTDHYYQNVLCNVHTFRHVSIC